MNNQATTAPTKVVMHCRGCQHGMELIPLLDQAMWCRWPDKWLRWECPGCGYGNTIRLESGKITEGDLFGLLSPVLVPDQVHEIQGLLVTYEKRGVIVRIRGKSWGIPQDGGKRFSPEP